MSESKQKGMGGVGGMIDSKRHLPQDPEGSFAEKTVLVTGANSGLVSGSLRLSLVDCLLCEGLRLTRPL